MENIFYIRENPIFVFEFRKKHLSIRIGSEQIKLYEYKNIKAIYLKKDVDILPYITRNIIASLIIILINKMKSEVLVIETLKEKDEIKLKKCDIEKTKKIIGKLSNIVTKNEF